MQEDFIVSGTPTLEMLDDYIRQCDGLIHLEGDMTGSPARPQSLAAIRKRYPDLAQKLTPIGECLQPGGPSLSYTQWEAWLALLHGRKLFIDTPDAEAPRDGKYVQDPAQIQAQQDHLARLRGMERYPGVSLFRRLGRRTCAMHPYGQPGHGPIESGPFDTRGRPVVKALGSRRKA